jgi:UDP-glucuronate 4-epimerase
MNSTQETWLVTGASGCIGAWTTLTLIREGANVVALHRSGDNHRLRMIVSGNEPGSITTVQASITDLDVLERVLAEHEVTHVIHLAALQAPFCKADPPLGAQVNVTGTTNMLEAVKRYGLETPFVYASSAGVYDAAGEMFTPAMIYGVYKIANEGCARIYWEDHRVASVGLRPLVAYGPGRDQGMTASPTEAMFAVAAGKPFHIPFGGRMQLQYAPDVARAFIDAARTPPTGACVFNLGGPVVSMQEIVDAIGAAAPEAQVTFDEIPLPFASRLPEPWFEMPLTPLVDGVRATLEVFARQSTRSPGG